MTPVVVFTENNARILYSEPDLWEGHPQALVAPSLDEVQGVEPHFWKRVGDKILPMNDQERDDRYAHLEKHGAINSLPDPLKRPDPALPGTALPSPSLDYLRAHALPMLLSATFSATLMLLLRALGVL